MIVEFINTIGKEMFVGNFSLAILIIGVLQLLEMKKKNRRSKMVEVIIVLKNGKKPFIETWQLDNRECLLVKDNGITIYESDGSFRAFYYAHSVISIEVKDILGDS